MAYTIARVGEASLKSVGQAESGKAAHGRVEYMYKGRSPCYQQNFFSLKEASGPDVKSGPDR